MENEDSNATNQVLKKLRSLFIEHVQSFAHANVGLRLNKKHYIGEAMWTWLIDEGFITPKLRAQAEVCRVDSKTGPDGHPLWRVAFRRTVRGDPVLDKLFDGKRVGPTPLYARLAAEGVVPQDPAEFMRRHTDQSGAESSGLKSRFVSKAEKYVARQELILSEEGTEWVYVYTTNRELDNLHSHNIRPLLKIGSTKHHYTDRIAEQAGSTAAHSMLVCLFAYRVISARSVESLIHKELKQQDRHIKDAPGIEWFSATPEETHKIVLCLAE